MAKISAQIYLALCMMVFCTTSSFANKPAICTEVGRPCKTNSDCCNDCCDDTSGLCLKSCAPSDNPCNRVDCGLETCVLEQVTCVTAPCEPAPVCKPEAITDPCAIVRCRAGYHCEPQQVQCITAPCHPVGRCVPDANTNPCITVKCSAGYHCEPRQVQCIKAPCPPIGQCVPDEIVTDPCATVRCMSGYHCESKEVQCFAPPCRPIPECVPNVNPCAAVLCLTGTQCVVQPGSNTASCVPIHSGGGCKSK